MKETILHVINTHQGLRGTELAVKVMEILNPLMFNRVDYERILDELIKEEEIVELEYTLPHMNYRIKSIYFPKGTVFNVQNNNRRNTSGESV